MAVINEVFTQRYFSNRNPLGQHLSAIVRGERKSLEIVGIARNTNTAGLRAAPPPLVYVPYWQLTGNIPTTLAIRGTGGVRRLSSALQQQLQAKLPDTPIDIRPLSSQVEATIVRERMMATLAGAFGALALILACVGLYGLLAYSVARRTREIGIRMALGARESRVVAMVLRSGARPVLAGIAIGLPAAWAASRLVESMLFALQPDDPAVIAGAAALLMTAALLASYLPARRASRLEPVTALRVE